MIEQNERPRVLATDSKLVVRNFPVTCLMSAQFVLFFVVPGSLSNDDEFRQNISFALFVFAPVIVTCFVAEYFRRSSNEKLERPERVDRSGQVLTGLGLLGMYFVGSVFQVFWGIGSLEGQVFGSETSAVQTGIVSFLTASKFACIAVCVVGIRRGLGSSVNYYIILATLVLVNVATGLQVGFLAGPLVTTFTVVASLIVMTAIPLRGLLVAILCVIVALPLLLQLRNDQRTMIGVDSSVTLTLEQRLRQDLVIAQLENAIPSEEAAMPSIADAFRESVPSFLDPGREPFNPAQTISLATGSSETTANTFTQPGNIYYMFGLLGLVVFYAILTLAISIVGNRNSEVAATIIVCMINFFVYFGGTFPATIPSFVHAGVSALIAYIVIRSMVSLFIPNCNQVNSIDVSVEPLRGGL